MGQWIWCHGSVTLTSGASDIDITVQRLWFNGSANLRHGSTTLTSRSATFTLRSATLTSRVGDFDVTGRRLWRDGSATPTATPDARQRYVPRSPTAAANKGLLWLRDGTAGERCITIRHPTAAPRARPTDMTIGTPATWQRRRYAHT